MWAYKGVLVHPVTGSMSGIRWCALNAPGAPGTLKSDTKQGMRELITHYIANPAS